jgi:glycosyltransferase involved in cell wall biosynthesis
MKPKILFIVQLPPPIHGVTLMNKYTVEHPCWKQNFEVKILPLHFGQRLEDIGKITPGKILYLIGFIFRLCFTLLKFKPSLVYFTIVPTGKIFYRDALITSVIKLFGPRIVFHLHRRGVEDIVNRSQYKRWLYKRTFKGVTAICLSEKLTHDIRSVYDHKPFILPNGINVVHNVIAKRENRTPNIIFLSNLVKSKGIEVFLQSMVHLRKQGCAFKARIVGEEVDYSIEEAKAFCIREGIADVVQIVGPRFEEEKFEELRKSDIFVLPSYSECAPLSILEAMQFGLTVVSTNVGGIPDIITHGTNGVLISPGSVKELAARLKQLINDKALRKKLGYNAREKFMQDYTLKTFYDGLLDIFKQVLNDAPKKSTAPEFTIK